MELEEDNENCEAKKGDNSKTLNNDKKGFLERKQQKFSFFEIKKRLVLKEFINILKNID